MKSLAISSISSSFVLTGLILSVVLSSMITSGQARWRSQSQGCREQEVANAEYCDLLDDVNVV
jgi:hypothetical protein